MQHQTFPLPSGMSIPPVPQGVSEHHQTANLPPGAEYMLDGKLRKVKMGLAWDAGCDVDASVCMLGEDKTTLLDCVSYRKLTSSCKSVKHSGDDRTGEGGGDDEVIKVALMKLPASVHCLLFTVSVYQKPMLFQDVRRCHARLFNKKDGLELTRVNLSKNPTTDQAESMAMCALMRKGGWWSFVSLGVPLVGRVGSEILKVPDQLAGLRNHTTWTPPFRLAEVCVRSGHDLAVKDKAFFSAGSSDPFFEVNFTGRGGKRAKVNYKSEVKEKDLNPTWQERWCSLGPLTESDSKCLKVRVFDHDQMSAPDFMGTVRIPASAIWNLGPGKVTLKCPLQPELKRSSTTNVKGHLMLDIRVQDIQAPAAGGGSDVPRWPALLL